MTITEAASGGNGVAIWCTMLASFALFWLAWGCRDPQKGYLRQVWDGDGAVYVYSIIGLGLGLYACRAGLWEPYYMAGAAGYEEWARAYQVRARSLSSALSTGQAIVAALHLRFLLRRVFGRAWFASIIVFVAVMFLAHAYAPRLL